MSLQLELPLTLLDGMTRTLLLTELVPGVFLNSAHPSINTSPFGLVFGSLVRASAYCSLMLLIIYALSALC